MQTVEVEACRITKAWSVYEETKIFPSVLAKLTDYKHVHIHGNKILDEIVKRIQYMIHVPTYLNPYFCVDGRWFMLNRADFKDYPKRVVVFQMNIQKPPDQDGRVNKISTRLVEITFREQK